jgi:hypothetical protein
LGGEAIAGCIISVCSSRKPLLIGLCEDQIATSHARRSHVFDHALTKPVALSELLKLIARRPCFTTI